MEMEYFIIQMVAYIKAILKKMKGKEMEYIYMKMVMNLMAYLKIIMHMKVKVI